MQKIIYKLLSYLFIIGSLLHASDEKRTELFSFQNVITIYAYPSKPDYIYVTSERQGTERSKSFDLTLFLERDDGFDVRKTWRIYPEFDFGLITRELMGFFAWNHPKEHSYTMSYLLMERSF